MTDLSPRSCAPDWLHAAVARADEALARDRPRPPAGSAEPRPAAVLVLFGDGPHGPDVLLLERSAGLRNHASQPAFPGGGADAGDASRVDTALREAEEEVGLDPAGVEVLATTTPLYLPASRFTVTPVIGWWHTPCAVAPVDPAETAFVSRVPLAELAEPGNRFAVRYPPGLLAPAFRVHGMFVWGFTAGILDVLLRLGGWERPWRPVEVTDYPFRQRGAPAPPAAAEADAGGRPVPSFALTVDEGLADGSPAEPPSARLPPPTPRTGPPDAG
jgi:8-oxo-dGTP pyrophosphatase MutT (NUDIX family)